MTMRISCLLLPDVRDFPGGAALHPDEYTPDAICRAMGLPAFANDPAMSRGEQVLRLLLTPSFDPEICVTLSFSGDDAAAEVRAFGESFWSKSASAEMPRMFLEAVTIPRAPLIKIPAKIRHALREVQEQEKTFAILDGIGANLLFRPAGDVLELRANVRYSEQLRRLVAAVLRHVHAGLPQGECRHALAVAGEYVEIRLSRE